MPNIFIPQAPQAPQNQGMTMMDMVNILSSLQQLKMRKQAAAEEAKQQEFLNQIKQKQEGREADIFDYQKGRRKSAEEAEQQAYDIGQQNLEQEKVATQKVQESLRLPEYAQDFLRYAQGITTDRALEQLAADGYLAGTPVGENIKKALELKKQQEAQMEVGGQDLVTKMTTVPRGSEYLLERLGLIPKKSQYKEVVSEGRHFLMDTATGQPILNPETGQRWEVKQQDVEQEVGGKKLLVSPEKAFTSAKSQETTKMGITSRENIAANKLEEERRQFDTLPAHKIMEMAEERINAGNAIEAVALMDKKLETYRNVLPKFIDQITGYDEKVKVWNALSPEQRAAYEEYLPIKDRRDEISKKLGPGEFSQVESLKRAGGKLPSPQAMPTEEAAIPNKSTKSAKTDYKKTIISKEALNGKVKLAAKNYKVSLEEAKKKLLTIYEVK